MDIIDETLEKQSMVRSISTANYYYSSTLSESHIFNHEKKLSLLFQNLITIS